MSFFASGPGSDSESEAESLASSSSSSKPTKSSGPKKSGGGGGMFATGDTDSEDESSDEDTDSDSSSDEEEEMSDEDGEKKPTTKSKANAFLRGGDGSDDDSDDDDEDDGVKVVKSAQDKRVDELNESLKSIENAGKTGDRKNWVVIATEFDKILRLLQRFSLTTLPGTTNYLPPQFVSTLIGLPEDVDASLKAEKTAAKKSSQANAKALNSMKQKVKKVLKENEEMIALYKKDIESYTQQYFLTTRGTTTDEAPAPKAKKTKKAARDDDEEEDEEFMTVGKGGKTLDLSKEGVFKTLKTIQEARGRKNTDRREQISILNSLRGVASNTYSTMRILLTLLSARFDFNPSTHAYMPIEDWTSARAELTELFELLVKENGSYQIVEILPESELEKDEWVERVAGEGGEGETVWIRGSLIALVDRLDEEFTKSLQWIDAHGMEYVERLKDESALYAVLGLSQMWFEKVKQDQNVSRIVLRRLEHVYLKPDPVVLYLEQAAEKAIPSVTSSSIIPSDASPSALIHALCVYLYKSGDGLTRTRAMLSHIYHHGLSGRYYEARDMLLMSHLQGAIQHADQGSQILYNRAIVQLGLAAFRMGLISECRSILLELFASQRPKELLAQGFPTQKFSQISPEQERADKLRTLPFHMHINLELAEAAFLVSCMLCEIPMLAKGSEDESGRSLPSKPFKKLLEQADRQTFMGAPETTRNCIEQASKALQNADWEGCRDLILQIKVWSLLGDAEAISEMLAKKIQEEGLRTYLNTFAPFYDTLSLSLLSSTFSLSMRSVTSIVSKMIHNGVLPASLDQIDRVVVFYRVEQTKVQQLAQNLADKAKLLNDNNQKALEIKLGTGGERGERGGERGDAADGGKGRGERRGASRGRGGRGGRGGKGAFSSTLGSQRRVGTTA